MCFYIFLCLIFSFLLTSGCSAVAQDIEESMIEPPKPSPESEALWEGGLGSVLIWTPDYPGASQGKTRYIPAPWFYYRGPYLRADEDGGVRGRFVNQSRWEVDLSIGASFPADSSDNDARRGMQDLDWIFEIGPNFIYYFNPRNSKNKFTFETPIRMVSSTDFGRVDGRGYTAVPEINYEDKQFFHSDFKAGVSASAVFGNRQLNEYFYEVRPHEVLPDRPEYHAKQGFMGTKISFRIFWQATRNFRVIAGYTGSSYKGVTNESSPLMKARWTNSGAIGFLWRFYESESRGFQ